MPNRLAGTLSLAPAAPVAPVGLLERSRPGQTASVTKKALSREDNFVGGAQD